MTEASAAPVAAAERRRESSLWGDVWTQFTHHRGAVAGSAVFKHGRVDAPDGYGRAISEIRAAATGDTAQPSATVVA